LYAEISSIKGEWEWGWAATGVEGEKKIEIAAERKGE